MAWLNTAITEKLSVIENIKSLLGLSPGANPIEKFTANFILPLKNSK